MQPKKTGGELIAEFTKAMAGVKKMTIDPNNGQVLRRENKSILEDAYEKSGATIPVEVKKDIEDKKQKMKESEKPVKDTVAAYYAMMQGTTKQAIKEQEEKRRMPVEDMTITVKKLPNEQSYMEMLARECNKKR